MVGFHQAHVYTCVPACVCCGRGWWWWWCKDFVGLKQGWGFKPWLQVLSTRQFQCHKIDKVKGRSRLCLIQLLQDQHIAGVSYPSSFILSTIMTKSNHSHFANEKTESSEKQYDLNDYVASKWPGWYKYLSLIQKSASLCVSLSLSPQRKWLQRPHFPTHLADYIRYDEISKLIRAKGQIV